MPLAEAEQKQRFQEIYQSAMADTFKIAIGSPSGGEMIMVSALDCPACLHIERELSKRKVSYYVVPSFLNQQNKQFSKNAYCATDSAKVWKAYMMRESNVLALNANNCNYPESDIKDLSSMLGGATPAAIFSDGGIMVGADKIFKKMGLN